MENAASWPANKYGTSWRRATIFLDCRDEDVVGEAIETVDPSKITVRSHVIAIGSAFGDGRLPLRQHVGMVQETTAVALSFTRAGILSYSATRRPDSVMMRAGSTW
jgi:hypothetical protein